MLPVLFCLAGCHLSNPDNTSPTATPKPPVKATTKEDRTITVEPPKISKNGVPKIIEVSFPDRIPSGKPYAMGKVEFIDLDGDIYTAQFTLIEGGCMDFEFLAFNPMESIIEGNAFSGTFGFQQSCLKCPDSSGDLLHMQIQLFDRSGHESAPAYYAFTCQ